MTGEMLVSDVTADAYPLHFAIAKALGGEVKPFDQYQGPYVVVGVDIRVGAGPYALAPTHLGVVRLWLQSDDGALCTIYNEANDKVSDAFFFDDVNSAIAAAESVAVATKTTRLKS